MKDEQEVAEDAEGGEQKDAKDAEVGPRDVGGQIETEDGAQA